MGLETAHPCGRPPQRPHTHRRRGCFLTPRPTAAERRPDRHRDGQRTRDRQRAPGRRSPGSPNRNSTPAPLEGGGQADGRIVLSAGAVTAAPTNGAQRGPSSRAPDSTDVLQPMSSAGTPVRIHIRTGPLSAGRPHGHRPGPGSRSSNCTSEIRSRGGAPSTRATRAPGHTPGCGDGSRPDAGAVSLAVFWINPAHLTFTPEGDRPRCGEQPSRTAAQSGGRGAPRRHTGGCGSPARRPSSAKALYRALDELGAAPTADPELRPDGPKCSDTALLLGVLLAKRS